MRSMIEDDQQRRRFAVAGPGRIRRDFGVEAMVEGNLAVYGEIIDERAG
jgi:hypothetical protein